MRADIVRKMLYIVRKMLYIVVRRTEERKQPCLILEAPSPPPNHSTSLPTDVLGIFDEPGPQKGCGALNPKP